jgi:hypothetical protein
MAHKQGKNKELTLGTVAAIVVAAPAERKGNSKKAVQSYFSFTNRREKLQSTDTRLSD